MCNVHRFMRLGTPIQTSGKQRAQVIFGKNLDTGVTSCFNIIRIINELNRFRNISRIMDCVSCEKCRVWGKLEMLGLGTAIKILLTPEEEFAQIPIKKFLSRQEVCHR